MPLVRKPRGRGGRGQHHHSEDDESTPICRCRVLYLGSAVPHITKDGLQGIQEPLKELYPDSGLSSLKGIDSWLSVWSNGLLLENVDEKNTKITRFFPIESLHYCAAVRNVLVPATSGGASSSSEKVQKFLPLDSPFARLPNLNHPPLFACILRRTTGIKVLECHAFICKREMAANALVRCCFHAYADSTYAKQLENGGTAGSAGGVGGGGGTGTLPSTNGTGGGGGGGMTNGYSVGTTTVTTNGGTGTLFSKDTDSGSRPIQRSVTPLDSIEKVTGWQAHSQNGDSDIIVVANSTDDDFTDGPMTSSTPRGAKFEFRADFPDDDEIYEGDENHKVWGGNNSTLGQNGTSSELVYLEPDGTLKSVKSHTSRLSRPRQFMSPPPPPPPPPPQQFSLLKSAEEDAASTNKKKIKKKLKKEINKNQQMHHIQQQQQQQYSQHNGGGGGRYLIRPASMMNLSSPQGLQPTLSTRPGSVLNGPVSHRPSSAMSTLQRSRPIHPHHHHQLQIPPHHPHHQQQQQLIPVPQHGANGFGVLHHPGMHPQPIYGHLPPPHHFAMHPHPQLVKASKSKKKQKQQLTPLPILTPTPIPLHPSPHMNPTPPPMFHHQKMMSSDDIKMMKHIQQQQYHHQMHQQHQQQQQQQMHHHHQQQQQHNQHHQSNGHGPESMMVIPSSHYATIERGYHYHTSRHMNGGGGGGGGNGDGGRMGGGGGGDSATLVSNKSKSKSSSRNDSGGGGSPGSPFGTGIYRKKGHLNERAFSYSIRQEHRSRSYGSLANLQFVNNNESSGGGPQLLRPSGSPPSTAEGMKKEREIIQMVRDLDLSGDEIERSQVPSEMYPGNRKTNGYRLQNGHGPRITHR